MKLIYSSTIVIFCLTVISCKKEMGHYDEFLIINNSSHELEYTVMGVNPTMETIGDLTLKLKSSESKTYTNDTRFKGRGEDKEDYAIYPPMFFADSVIVCYDDTICITHYFGGSNNIPKNNFLWSTPWVTKSIETKQLQHTFTFTDEDYQEAFDNQ